MEVNKRFCFLCNDFESELRRVTLSRLVSSKYKLKQGYSLIVCLKCLKKVGIYDENKEHSLSPIESFTPMNNYIKKLDLEDTYEKLRSIQKNASVKQTRDMATKRISEISPTLKKIRKVVDSVSDEELQEWLLSK